MTNIAYQIKSQFPAIYKEHGQELIELAQDYYRFLETTDGQFLNTSRNFGKYRDIDTTLDELVIFFKKKFMSGLPNTATSTRFAVKHILDLYRRKGTQEGIELFFRMFYNESVSIYYPSKDILRPSASIWNTRSYVELQPVSDISVLQNLTSAEITGSISNATANLEYIEFMTISGVTFPAMFLSSVRGSFSIEDKLFDETGLFLGVIKGSLTGFEIVSGARTDGNDIGDQLSIFSNAQHAHSVGRVSQVTQLETGEIPFKIVDGGYGYAIGDSEIIVSDQIAYFPNGTSSFRIMDEVEQGTATGYITGFTGPSVGIELHANSTPFTAGDIDVNGVPHEASFVSSVNSTASADVGELTHIQSLSAYTDLLINFVDVPLNSSNYSTVPPALAPMSGVSPVNINTPLKDAFDPVNFSIGSISELANINPGFDYTSEQYIHALGPEYLRKLQIHDQHISLVNKAFVISPGTVVTQSNGASGIVTGSSGGFFIIRPRSLTRFNLALPLLTPSASLPIEQIMTDYNSSVLGENANIIGGVEFGAGKIEELAVTDSGFGFYEGQTIYAKNVTNPTADPWSVSGIAKLSGMGKSAGRWDSNTSKLNSSKVLQDSYYYQDYSYEISSPLSKSTYEELLKESVHPAGVKMFHKFVIEGTLDSSITADLDITVIT